MENDKLITSGTSSSMYLSQIVDSIQGVTVLNPKIITDTNVTLQFPKYGNIYYLLQLNNNCNIKIENIPILQYQTITLVLQQSKNGNSYPTFISNIEWENDKLPTIDIRPNKETILEIIGFNNKLKGRKIYG